MRSSFIVLAALLFALTPALAQTCPATCRLPTCYCASNAAPGGLTRAETPQFVLVTFDDAIQARLEDQALKPVFAGVTNPGGRPAHRTYFAQAFNTDPAVAKAVVEAGHEIANHTHTHTTGIATDGAEWRRQLDGLERFFRDTVGVDASQIVGFRAPYLATNDAMWEELRRRGVLYESSLAELADGPFSAGIGRFVWPHTLDFGAQTACVAAKCPSAPLPGVWSVPMWVLYNEEGRKVGEMDPQQTPAYTADSTALYTMLRYNFDAHYTGNRAPLALYLHAGRVRRNDHAIAAFRRFLREVANQPDVWLVTMKGLVYWMQHPVPASQMAAWFDGGGERGALAATASEATEHPATSGTLRIWPNPSSSGQVHTSAHAPVEVYDLTGRRVAEAMPMGDMLDLSAVAPGAYLVRSGTERTLWVRR